MRQEQSEVGGKGQIELLKSSQSTLRSLQNLPKVTVEPLNAN